MKQLTLRGFDKELTRRIRSLARSQGISLNKAALQLLRKGAGLSDDEPDVNRVGDSLDDLIGTWSEDEAFEFQEAVRDFDEVDPALWS